MYTQSRSLSQIEIQIQEYFLQVIQSQDYEYVFIVLFQMMYSEQTKL